MNWMVLVIASLFEVVWAIGIKYSHGFTKPIPSIITLVCMAASMGLLSFAAKSLPIGTAYAVWTGLGAVGTAIAGMVLFHEPSNFARLFFIFLIVAGIAGLKFVSPD